MQTWREGEEQHPGGGASKRGGGALWVALGLGFVFGVGAACSSGGANVCNDKNVHCSNGLICDPSDGICKCGGRGGVVCPSDWVCDPVSNTCQSTKCAGVDCASKPGTSCDVVDGTCKCGGTGGKVCAATEVCNPNAKACIPAIDCNQVACPKNQMCDATTGHCKCGQTECAVGDFCSVSGQNGQQTCVASLCTGVQCSGATVCDPADGYCKCNGTVCQSGEACACPAGSDGGTCDPTARACKPGSACAGVGCDGGTTCDPSDGFCKCGGPGGPQCAGNQICSLSPSPQCEGGAQCTLPDGGPKDCPGGTSCDPEDGICKCGGRGGTACADATATDPAEICVAIPNGQQSCKRPCDVRSPDCPAGSYCFFDSSALTPAAYCSPPTDSKLNDDACNHATDCFQANPPKALHCNGLALGQAGICRDYCDVAGGNQSCIQVPKPQTCNQINLAPMGFGYCQPQ